MSEFGNLKYVHVIIDTCSEFIFASIQTGEASKHVISHLLTAFSVMGQPQQIKTDNGPGYTSKTFLDFCATLEIVYITGIPYNPQGQGIVERTHLTLKNTTNKLKGRQWYPTQGMPRNIVAHALFIINFLTLDQEGKSAASQFWQRDPKSDVTVMWGYPLHNSWHSLDPVLTWGRGLFAFILEKQWIWISKPLRSLKPHIKS